MDEMKFTSDVSIHVPTRDTTVSPCRLYLSHAVSIHVPTRDTTRTADNTDVVVEVSIHVPTRDTTVIDLIN